MSSTGHSCNPYSQKKLLDPEQLAVLLRGLREEKKTVATVNGSFDLLHAGHLYFLYEAAQRADILIAALNTDSSIQRYKSPNRPIIPLAYRMEMMAAIGFIDYVTYFDEDDPRQLLKQIRPDVHVNGAEYGNDCIEAEVVRQHGGRLHLVEKVPGLSTTQIIEKILKTCG